MAGDEHFGAKRQYYAKLLIEIFVLLANENRKPAGFQRCRWERETTIRVAVETWKAIPAFIRAENFRGYDINDLPSPTRYVKELLPILRQLQRLNLAEFNEDDLSQQGTKSDGIEFLLTNLPSRSVKECHAEMEQRIKTDKQKPKEPEPSFTVAESKTTALYTPRTSDIKEYFSTVPRSLSIKFVGREETLDTLHEKLINLPEQKILAVTSMGGQGKTELCIQYGKRYLLSYKGGICWISAREGGIARQILSFAKSVGYEIKQKNQTEEELLSEVWNAWRDENTLFIYDDVVELHPHLLPPDLERFTVLITTRDKELGLNVKNFPLDELPLPDALDLFGELITVDRLQKELLFGEKLITFVDGLPLGIELLGGYLRSDLNITKTLEQITKFLNDKRSTWSVIDTEVFSPEEFPLKTNQRNINECFDLSWVQLDESDKKIANFIATLHRKRANSNFISSILTETAEELGDQSYSIASQRQAFKRLIRYSLIKYLIIDSVHHYSYHLLLRDFVRNQMSKEERLLWGGVIGS